MKFFLIMSLFFINTFSYAEKPLSVVVVGGGPVGLSAAIEAVDSGAQVTVLEKRVERGRRQTVFLSDQSIELLKRWHVLLPSEFVVGEGSAERIAIVPIHVLEGFLEEQAKQRGVKLLKAEFETLDADHSLKARSDTGELLSITYDLLVAADGAHSTVRTELEIPLDLFGKMEGALAWLPLGVGEVEFAITDPIMTQSGYIRRIQSAEGSLIFSQGNTQGVGELLVATAQQGWKDEVQMIQDHSGTILGSIPVFLQQACYFSDSTRAAILLGDAAATGSFFLGLALNTGLEGVRNAGDLIRELQSKDERSYSNFEVRMKETTDPLIEANRFLFLDSKVSSLDDVNYGT